MKNEIVASVEFYFKGERYSPKATINLDRLMKNQKNDLDILASIHPLLAKENGIDTYSYQFEIMLAETIQFSDATGIAKKYCLDGHFSMAEFEKVWHEENILEQIKPIAKLHLAIDDLSQHPKLKTALMAAFLKGKENSQPPG